MTQTSRVPEGTVSRFLVRAVLCLTVVMPLLAMLISPATAQDGYYDRMYKIKAAYLYNFAKYVQWPSQTADHTNEETAFFTIGVVGSNPFGNSLSQIATQKKLGGREIRIIHVKHAKMVPDCEILFFCSNAEDSLVKKILVAVRGQPTLLVGETAGFANHGGMINFTIENNKVRFEINSRSAEDAGVEISSKLLRLGKQVSR